MTRRNLYILVEESFRELRSRVLLVRAILRPDVDIIIGQQWWFAANLRHLPLGVVLFKGNNSAQADFMAAAKRAGHSVASIEEEAFGLKAHDVFATLFDERVCSVCDLFLVQGNDLADFLRARFPSALEKIKVVGNPRTEALQSYLRSGSDREASAFRARHGPFILVNTNYASINPFDYDAYTYFRRCIGVGVLDPGNAAEMEMFHGQCLWEKQNLRVLIAFIRKMAAEHPEIPIVLRPHPSENQAIWHSSLGNLSSLYIVSDDDHLPWTLACSALVHSGSTTGLEAVLLGREGINICAGVSAWHDRFIASVVNTNVKDADEAVAAVERELSVGWASKSMSQRLSDLQAYLRTDDDQSPSEKIADALLAICPLGIGSDLNVGRLRIPESSGRQRFKAFVPREKLEDLLREVAGSEGQESDIRIDELAPSVWRLRAPQRSEA